MSLRVDKNHKLLAKIVQVPLFSHNSQTNQLENHRFHCCMLMVAYEAQSRDKEWAAEVCSVYFSITRHTLIFHFQKQIL